MRQKNKIEISEKQADDFIIIEDDSLKEPKESTSLFKKYRLIVIIGASSFILFLLFNFNTFYAHFKKPAPLKATSLTTAITPSKEVPIFKEQWVLDKDMLEIITTENQQNPLPWAAIKEIEEIFSWSIGLRNLRQGDTITVLWDKPLDANGNSSGTISALSLHSASLENPIFAFQFKEALQPAFYDWNGRPWKRMFLRSPVKYGRISSSYNLSRLNPVVKKVKAHKGTDFAAPEGAEILALANGVLSHQDYGQHNGNYVKIIHDSIYSTGYLHLSAFAENLSIGDSVQQGQVIGYVGSTGSSTGPHVCLRFYRRTYQDDFIRAFPYLPKPKRLPFQKLPSFQQKRDSLQALLQVQ